MNIILTLKCGYKDSFYFIQQIASIKTVEKVFVFRDEKSLDADKVQYIVSKNRRLRKINFIIRFFQMVLDTKYKPKIFIGIYEIPHGLLAMLAGKVRKIPSVVSITGNPAYTKLRRGLRLKLTMWILKNCTYITVTGNNSRKYLIQQRIPGEKIFILPNTLDFTLFRKLGLNREYDIISLGRISEEKHIEIIVKIVAELKAKIPNIKAAIGGDGPQKEMIINLVKQLKLDKNIDVCGYITPNEDLTSFFNKGKVFLLTSETEGFPRTIIQAAACGLPVVASNVGDITDVIDHGINGFLVNGYSNVKEFSSRVFQLLNDNELYEQFSITLEKIVRQQFVTENASKVWQNIFDEIK
jgi:glycosyltransferase involved in cell wall biosynthesis